MSSGSVPAPFGCSPLLEVFVEIWNGCARRCTGCVVPIADKHRRDVDRPLDLALLSKAGDFAARYLPLSRRRAIAWHLRWGDLGLLRASHLGAIRSALGDPRHLSATVAPTVHAARPDGFLEALVDAPPTPVLVDIPYDPLRDTAHLWPLAWLRRLGPPGPAWWGHVDVVLTRSLLERLAPAAFVERHLRPLAECGFLRSLGFTPYVPPATRAQPMREAPPVDAVEAWLCALFDTMRLSLPAPVILVPFVEHIDALPSAAPFVLDEPPALESYASFDLSGCFHVGADHSVGPVDYAFGELRYGPVSGHRPVTRLDDPDGPERLVAAVGRFLARRARAIVGHPKCRRCAWRARCFAHPHDLLRGRGLDDTATASCWALPGALAAAARYHRRAAPRRLLAASAAHFW